LEGDGLVLSDGKYTSRISWAEVSRLTARKYDFVTTDALGLTITVAGGQIYEVTEDVDGYIDLVREICARFPEVSPGWEREIVLPAFQTNERIIYERGAGGNPRQ
jgi:hypothetical protein